MSKLGVRCRWTPHTNNPADALTKWKGCHLAQLLTILKNHCWTLRHEEEEFGEMQAVRQERGYTPRPKVGHEFTSLDSDDEDFMLTFLALALTRYPSQHDLSEPPSFRKFQRGFDEERNGVGDPEVQSSLSSPQINLLFGIIWGRGGC